MAAVVFFVPTALPEKSNEADTFRTETALSRTAEIICGDNIATAFIYKSRDDGAVVVTCWHTVQGHADTAQFRFYGKEEFVECTALIGYDPGYDIAIYLVPCDEQFDEMSVRDDTTTGEEVFLLGNSDGDGIALFSGKVSVPDDIVLCRDDTPASHLDNKNLPSLRVTAPINSGSSGAPVFDSHGRLAGMGFYQFFGSAERPVYDMNYAVPAAIIKSVVDVCEIQSGRVQRSGVTLRNYVASDDEMVTRRIYEVQFDGLWQDTVFRKSGGSIYAHRSDGVFKVASLAGKKIDTIAQLLAAAIDYEYRGGKLVLE